MGIRDRFYIGQVAVLTAYFIDENGDPVAPTTVSFMIRTPSGTETIVTTPDAKITNPSTGTYVFTRTVADTETGTHYTRIKNTGTEIATIEDWYEILPSNFTSP